MTILIVGLGNPGSKYTWTRHNIGFLLIDELIHKFQAQSKGARKQAEWYEAKKGPHTLYFLKPQTYMNCSGDAVGYFFHFYKCQPEQLIVIHDELDFDPGMIRIKQGGSHGGHNGLLSIHQAIGKENLNYIRFRVGIGHPRRLGSPQSTSDFVLSALSQDERSKIEEQSEQIYASLIKILNGQLAQAMTELNIKKKS